MTIYNNIKWLSTCITILNFFFKVTFILRVHFFFTVYNNLCLLGPVMMSLKPGSQVAESYSEMSKGIGNTRRSQSKSGMLQLSYIQDQLGTKDGKEDSSCTVDDKSWTAVSNGEDLSLCSPPRTENEVLNDVGVATYRVIPQVYILPFLQWFFRIWFSTCIFSHKDVSFKMIPMLFTYNLGK